MRPERLDHPLGEGGVGDTDQLSPHAAGVGHRSEQIEHGGDTDLLARRSGEPERRVERRVAQARDEARRTFSGRVDMAVEGFVAEIP